jgi:hypothetical protein
VVSTRRSPSAARHTELGELCGYGLAVSGRPDILVDIRDPAVGADVERPPGREWLIRVDDAVRGRDRLGWIAEQRIVHPKRLREGPVRLRRIDTDGEVRDVERADLIPTLTE